jgi:membrane protein required for colicin V production
MNPYDVAILLTALVAGLIGAIKGLVRIVIGLAALVAAFLLASWFDGVVGSLFSGWIATESIRRLTGFGIIFLGVLIVGALAGWLFGKLLSAAHVRWLDRLAGAGLGILGAILLFAALTVPLAAYLPEDTGLLRDSRLAPWVMTIGRWVDAAVPASVRDRFRERLARLEEHWRRATTGASRPVPAPGSTAR